MFLKVNNDNSNNNNDITIDTFNVYNDYLHSF